MSDEIIFPKTPENWGYAIFDHADNAVEFDGEISEDMARRVLEIMTEAKVYQKLHIKTEDVLRAIAYQHPHIAKKFIHINWPQMVRIGLEQLEDEKS